MNHFTSQFNFEHKVIWVTGAGRGIGLAIAQTFTQLGATVVGFDCQFGDQDYPFICHDVDLSQHAEIQRVCQQVLVTHPVVDVLVNSAGVLRLGKLADLSITQWQRCFDVNVSSVFYLTQALMPVFKRQSHGVIVNIASNAARLPRMNMGAYCASKAALQSLSHCLALELAEFGVRCNLVSPGSTNTQMLQELLGDDIDGNNIIAGSLALFKNGIPLGKLASAQDIANSVVFLASDLASHISLQNLVVDGGATLSA